MSCGCHSLLVRLVVTGPASWSVADGLASVTFETGAFLCHICPLWKSKVKNWDHCWFSWLLSRETHRVSNRNFLLMFSSGEMGFCFFLCLQLDNFPKFYIVYLWHTNLIISKFMSLNYQDFFAIHVFIVAIFMLVQGTVNLLCWNDAPQ